MFNVLCNLCDKKITAKSQEKSSGGGIISVAKMKNDKVFWYGISGVFEFDPPIKTLKKGDSICNDCLKKHKIIPHKNTKCGTCGEMYQGTNCGREGWGCAASVHTKKGEMFISCGWGSHYDCMTFSVNRAARLTPRQLICDKCIAKLLKSHRIKEQSDLDGPLSLKGITP